MGLFDFLKRGEAPAPEPEVIPEPAPTEEPVPAGEVVRIEIRDTPEKFAPVAKELVPFLVDHLRALAALEADMFRRERELEKKKLDMGIPKHQTAPGWEELVEDYTNRYGQAARAFCTPKLLERGYARSWGRPGEYDYLNTGCDLIFTMKSARRAVVEARHTRVLLFRYQFVLKDTEDGWRVDQKSYAHGLDDSWHLHHI